MHSVGANMSGVLGRGSRCPSRFNQRFRVLCRKLHQVADLITRQVHAVEVFCEPPRQADQHMYPRSTTMRRAMLPGVCHCFTNKAVE